MKKWQVEMDERVVHTAYVEAETMYEAYEKARDKIMNTDDYETKAVGFTGNWEAYEEQKGKPMEKTMWQVRPIDHNLYKAFEKQFSVFFDTKEEAWDWWDEQQEDGWAQDDGIYECKVIQVKLTATEIKERK